MKIYFYKSLYRGLVNFFFTSMLLFLYQATQAQENTYIKYLKGANYGLKLRVIPSSDNGFYIVSLDSLRVCKMSSCGLTEWSKKYNLASTTAKAIDIIPTLDGGLAILVREFPSSGYYGIVLKLNSGGGVTWCKSIIDAPYTEVVYNLIQDDQANIYLYGNVTLISNNSVYNSLTKLSPGGVVQWRKLYDHGGIWGAAIQCKDDGFLLRTGNILIKTDASGNHQWSSHIQVPMYHYNKVIEVEDGFIFNGYLNNVAGGDTICFYKVNSIGNLMWGGIQKINFTGTPMDLKPKYNGNFLFMNKFEYGGKWYSGISELDKNLNLIAQSALPSEINQDGFEFRDINFLKDSTHILLANYYKFDPNLNIYTAFIRSNSSLEFTCDTNLNQFQKILQPAIANQITTSVTTRSFSSGNVLVTTVNENEGTEFYCKEFPQIQIDLGPDTILCQSNLTLKNQNALNFDRYLWSTGDTTSTIKVNQSGTYILRSYSSCRDENFVDSIQVEFKDFPTISWIADTSICSSMPLMLTAQIPNATYKWQDGSTDPVYAVREPGTYTVEVNYYSCSQTFQCEVTDCEELLLPNVITPNNDNFNESMKPIVMRGISSAELTLFNRWGQEIYFTRDLINRPWIGKAYSKECPAGVYYWVVKYVNYRGEQKQQQGTINLFTN